MEAHPEHRERNNRVELLWKILVRFRRTRLEVFQRNPASDGGFLFVLPFPLAFLLALLPRFHLQQVFFGHAENLTESIVKSLKFCFSGNVRGG